MPCLSLTLLPLISPKCAFNPTIDDIELLQQWGQVKTRARKRLAALERYQETVDDRFLCLLDDLIAFVKLWSDEAGFWSHYHPDDGMRDCGQIVRLGVQRLLLEITSSSTLVGLLEQVDTQKLDAEGKRYLSLIIRDFRRAGASLSGGDRRQLKQIDLKLAELAYEYVLVDEESDLWIGPEHLQHMPQSFQDSHQVDPSLGKVRISVDDDYNNLAEYIKDDDILKELYILRESRAPKNETVLKTMTELRHQKAKIFCSVRYPTFLHYSAEPDMMSCPDTVRSFLVDVNNAARSRADDEKRALSAVLEQEQRHLDEWNVQYAKRRLLERTSPEFDPVSARAYFPLKNVMNGAMSVLSKLFGIEFQHVEDVVSWHPSALAFDVYDAAQPDQARDSPGTSSGEEKEHDKETVKRGRLYLDLISRESKFHAPRAVPIRSSAKGSAIIAEICLSGCFGYTMDSHIGFDGCANILHELGHSVHFLLAQGSRFYRFNGFSNELDFIEVLSLLLEEFLEDSEVVSQMAVSLAGEVIPRECHEALVKSRDIDRAMTVRTRPFIR